MLKNWNRSIALDDHQDMRTVCDFQGDRGEPGPPGAPGIDGLPGKQVALNTGLQLS